MLQLNFVIVAHFLRLQSSRTLARITEARMGWDWWMGQFCAGQTQSSDGRWILRVPPDRPVMEGLSMHTTLHRQSVFGNVTPNELTFQHSLAASDILCILNSNTQQPPQTCWVLIHWMFQHLNSARDILCIKSFNPRVSNNCWLFCKPDSQNNNKNVVLWCSLGTLMRSTHFHVSGKKKYQRTYV